MYLCAYSGVQHVMCGAFLFCLSSSCVLGMVVSKAYCDVLFLLCLFSSGVLMYPMWPVSLDCPFLIALRFL